MSYEPFGDFITSAGETTIFHYPHRRYNGISCLDSGILQKQMILYVIMNNDRMIICIGDGQTYGSGLVLNKIRTSTVTTVKSIID